MTTSSYDAQLSLAYILHSRKYRDTSLIVEMLTARDGRVAAILRGGQKGKKKSGAVQPFTPLQVSYVGRGELKTLTKVEVGSMNPLRGESLLIGLYANELLVRLLVKFEEMPSLFLVYQELLAALAVHLAPSSAPGSALIENSFVKDTELAPLEVQVSLVAPSSVVLRKFEITLLKELGYGITFDQDVLSGLAIDSDELYRYTLGEGFSVIGGDAQSGGFKGELLLAIAKGNFSLPEVNACAKKIIRISVNELLAGKPLKSRELFQQYQSRIKAKH